MRARLLERGAEALADYEVLEMLLFLGIPRRDTKPLAKAVINRFGGLAAVLGAGRASLLATPGLTEECAASVALVQAAARLLAGAERREAPVLGDWRVLQAYLGGVPPAALRVLFLDGKNRLLADEARPADRLDAEAVRAILRRALELHGVSLLLACWRAEPEPTRADRDGLMRLRASGSAVSVGVHDLVLVVGEAVTSVQQHL
jgi:DNA repair protein RadC